MHQRNVVQAAVHWQSLERKISFTWQYLTFYRDVQAAKHWQSLVPEPGAKPGRAWTHSLDQSRKVTVVEQAVLVYDPRQHTAFPALSTGLTSYERLALFHLQRTRVPIRDVR